MKKSIFFVFVLFCIVGIKAQSLQLYVDSEIAPDTVKASIPRGELDQRYVDVKNISNDSVDVRVRKTILSNEIDAEIYYCWESCYPADVDLSPDVISIASDSVCINFSADFKSEKEGIAVVRYTFFDDANSEDSVSIVFVYDCKGSSIEDLSAETISLTSYPNPARETVRINHTLKNIPNARLKISNLAGGVVHEELVSSQKTYSIVDISNFAPGIYIYSICENDKTILAKKMIIAR